MKIIIALVIFISILGEKPSKEIYKDGEYIFSVKIIENNKEIGLKFYEPHYRTNENNNYKNAWELGKEKNIEFLGLEMMEGTINGGQKTIRWNYYNSDFKKITEEVTGLIENDSIIWLHPPRIKYFQILEINPFPEVRLHEKEWSTDLKVREQWGNKRWKTWKGNLNIISKYKFDKQKGKIVSEAHTGIGTTKLISEFNIEKGFTKFEYTNINGSRILLELIEVRR